jgi:uracil-DNA glycosylase
MYHPATALYNPRMKEILRKDWKNIEKEVGLSESKNKKG